MHDNFHPAPPLSAQQQQHSTLYATLYLCIAKKNEKLKLFLSFSKKFLDLPTIRRPAHGAQRKRSSGGSAHLPHAPIDGKEGERESHEDSCKNPLVPQRERFVCQVPHIHGDAEYDAEEDAKTAQKKVGVERLAKRAFLLGFRFPLHQQAEKTSGFSWQKPAW